MFVIKKGRIAITKTKGSGEIVLAELHAGQMLGEMAFFDNKPRSAGARAVEKTEVIVLPFNALYSQFKKFPEWLKATVRTVNSHLREANQRIKNLERAEEKDAKMFPGDVIVRLCAVISLVGFKVGEKTEEGLVIPGGVLRTYCIQIFHQPTHRMQKLLEVLEELQLLNIEDLGEGRTKVTLFDHSQITDFVDWYNKWLYTKEADRIEVQERHLDLLHALIVFGNKVEADANNQVRVNLTVLQNKAMEELGYQVNATDMDTLSELGLIGERISEDDNTTSTEFDLAEIKRLYPFWRIIHTLNKIPAKQ